MAFQFDFFSISLFSRHSHLLGILEPRFFFSPASPFYLLFSVAIILQIGKPIEPGQVSMCFYGIAAHDLSHARAAVNFVVLLRILQEDSLWNGQMLLFVGWMRWKQS